MMSATTARPLSEPAVVLPSPIPEACLKIAAPTLPMPIVILMLLSAIVVALSTLYLAVPSLPAPAPFP